MPLFNSRSSGSGATSSSSGRPRGLSAASIADAEFERRGLLRAASLGDAEEEEAEAAESGRTADQAERELRELGPLPAEQSHHRSPRTPHEDKLHLHLQHQQQGHFFTPLPQAVEPASHAHGSAASSASASAAAGISASASPLSAASELASGSVRTRSRSRSRHRYSSSRRHRTVQPLPFLVRWGGMLGSSFIIALGLVAAALYLGWIHRGDAPEMPATTAATPDTQIVAEAAANATAALTATRADFESELEAKRLQLTLHEEQRRKQQEEFRAALAQFDADIQRLAAARSKLEEKKDSLDAAAVSADAGADESPSKTKPLPPPPSPEATQPHLLLRHQLNVHMLARLFDKLNLGWPIVVGLLGGSISELPSAHLHGDERLNYASQLVEWLNTQFPVHQTSADRLRAGIPASNTRAAHQLASRTTGGTSSSTTSFCWAEAFSVESGPPEMPDLMLVDFAVHDAFIPPTAFDQAMPVASADNMDRIARAVLEEAELQRSETMQAQRKALATTGSTWTTEHQLQYGLRGTALFFVYFVAQRPAGTLISRQDAHSAIARRYAIPSVSEKEYILSSLRDPMLHGNASAFDTMQFNIGPDGTHPLPDGIHANVAGHRLMFRLVQTKLTEMRRNYLRSHRASFESNLLGPQMVELVAAPHAGAQHTPSSAPIRVYATDEPHSSGTDSHSSEGGSWRRQGSMSTMSTRDLRAHRNDVIWAEAAKEAERVAHPSATGATSAHDLTYARFRLPPILASPPLPLSPAHHAFNGRSSHFSCRFLYAPFASPQVHLQADAQFNAWFGLRERHNWVWSVRPGQEKKKGLAPDPKWLEQETKRLASAPVAVPAASANADPAHPQPQLPIGTAAALADYPRLKFRITPVRHSAVLFYLRGPLALGSVTAWLSCESESGVDLGHRSPAITIEARWTAQFTQAATAVLWPPVESFTMKPTAAAAPSSNSGSSDGVSMPCAFNTMHVVLATPHSFLIIGHAQN